VSGYQPLFFYQWLILLSITILSFDFLHRGKQGIHVRISIVQLGSIEVLYINPQPLHKVNIIKRKPIEGLCKRCLPLLKNGRELVLSFTDVDPQSSGSNLLA
jgi:hypothetical protein